MSDDSQTSRVTYWHTVLDHASKSITAWLDRLGRVQVAGGLATLLGLPTVLTLLGRSPAWVPSLGAGLLLALSLEGGLFGAWHEERTKRIALEQAIATSDRLLEDHRAQPRDDHDALAHRERLATFVAGLGPVNVIDVVRLAGRPETRQLATHIGGSGWGRDFQQAIHMNQMVIALEDSLHARVREAVAGCQPIARRGVDAMATVTRWLKWSATEDTTTFYVDVGNDDRFHLSLRGAPGLGSISDPSESALRVLGRACCRVGAEVGAWPEWQESAQRRKAAWEAWRDVLDSRPDTDTLKSSLRASRCNACE